MITQNEVNEQSQFCVKSYINLLKYAGKYMAEEMKTIL